MANNQDNPWNADCIQCLITIGGTTLVILGIALALTVSNMRYQDGRGICEYLYSEDKVDDHLMLMCGRFNPDNLPVEE